ncbi:hypothetical protein BG003_006215 [Podila horticola]|nr:hypothetical protein BG003_006215 [Podila horticola]
MDVHVFVTQIKEFTHMDDDGKAASRFQPGHPRETPYRPVCAMGRGDTKLSRGCYFGDKGDRTHAYVFYAKAYMAFEEKKSDWSLTHVALREAMEMAAERANIFL